VSFSRIVRISAWQLLDLRAGEQQVIANILRVGLPSGFRRLWTAKRTKLLLWLSAHRSGIVAGRALEVAGLKIRCTLATPFHDEKGRVGISIQVTHFPTGQLLVRTAQVDGGAGEKRLCGRRSSCWTRIVAIDGSPAPIRVWYATEQEQRDGHRPCQLHALNLPRTCPRLCCRMFVHRTPCRSAASPPRTVDAGPRSQRRSPDTARLNRCIPRGRRHIRGWPGLLRNRNRLSRKDSSRMTYSPSWE